MCLNKKREMKQFYYFSAFYIFFIVKRIRTITKIEQKVGMWVPKSSDKREYDTALQGNQVIPKPTDHTH